MALLEGKNIVVIGGTSGLGLSAARAFVNEGAKLIIVGRDSDAIASTEEVLSGNCRVLQGDAIDEATSKAAIDLCIQIWGGFDGLYHVAGGSGRKWGDGPLHELSLEGWKKTLDLNLTSLMLSNQAAVQQFLKMKKKGTILNMSSVLGFSPSPQHFATHAYAASKAAIIGFSKSIAAHYAKDNIRVNVIAPALIATNMSRRASKDEVIQKFITTKQPLDGGRMGKPEDVDALATYFMSDGSAFTTGQVVAVDGGWCISEGQN